MEVHMRNKSLVFRISILASLLFTISACSPTKPVFKGGAINPPFPAAEIKLTDHNGQPFTLSGQRGKVVLVYFGYTNCPDECPLTMAHVNQALQSIGDSAKNVQVVMVTTDPERDTSQVLKDYMANFNPTFLGLTGTTEELQKVWSDYGVTVEDGGETHSTFLYVIDPAGNLRETFLPDSVPADIGADVGLLLDGN
jgi:protein SCO1